MTVLVVVIAVAVAIAIAYASWQADKKRKAAMRAYATSQGWSFTERDDRQVERDGTPFGRGDTRRAKNVLSGQCAGKDFTAFDYTYVTTSSNGKTTQRTTHRFRVTCIRLRAALPTLELGPENVLHRIGGALGFDDIELESEDFNRRFRVVGSDRKFAYDVLHARTMTAMLALPDVAMRVHGAEVVVWDKGRLQSSTPATDIAAASVLIDGIPDFVWTDHTTGGTP